MDNNNDFFKKSKTIVTPVGDDLYNLTIGAVFVGQFERSDLRYIIEQIDNKILVGIKKKVEIEPMSPEEYMAMIKQGREADENDEDCLACGS